MENAPQPVEEGAASALPYDIASKATPNFSIPLPANAPAWPAASRKLQLSREEWEELKPTIQQLYIDEGKKFKEVAVVLQTNHNFAPTKKQFDDKIKKWGLRKNATRTQRALVLEELHNDYGGKGLETTLKLNPGKLERWEREEKLSGSLGSAQKGKAAEVSTSKAVDRRLSERALSPLREILEVSVASLDVINKPRTIWDMANIPGSPNLKGFFCALEIDRKYPIPESFHLPPPGNSQFISQEEWGDLVRKPRDESVETEAEVSNTLTRPSLRRRRLSNPPELLICEWILSHVEKSWTPLNEVSPFPTTAKPRKVQHRTYAIKASPWKSRRVQIIESEARLRKMQKVLAPDNHGLVAEMDHLAYLYFSDGKYQSAEFLYHRVALVRQNTLGPWHEDTLDIYLDVIKMKICQGRYSEAATLHLDLDPKIQNLFNPGHNLALHSRTLLAEIQYLLDEDEEAELLQREVLQITLQELGQRNRTTLQAMSDLGEMMRYFGEYGPSEQLLRTNLQISAQAEGDFEEDSYGGKLFLGDVLREQGRYEESCTLLRHAMRWVTSRYGIEHPMTLEGICRLAESLRMDGEFEESELLLRWYLWRRNQLEDLTYERTRVEVGKLAITMATLGCWTEAASLYEEVLRFESKKYGPDHRYTRMTRTDLEESYAMQGLYNDPEELAAKFQSVLESEEDVLVDILKPRRKYVRISELGDSDSDEVEEIRPCKRRKMTCTYNLKCVPG